MMTIASQTTERGIEGVAVRNNETKARQNSYEYSQYLAMRFLRLTRGTDAKRRYKTLRSANGSRATTKTKDNAGKPGREHASNSMPRDARGKEE